MAHRTSESPRRAVHTRNQSVSPPRVPERRAQSKSPPRLSQQRAESQSPPRLGPHRTQSTSPPRLTAQRAESKSPPRLSEDRAQSTSPPRIRGSHSPRDTRPLQSAGSERVQDSGRTRRKQRRATPTPSQRPAPVESDLHAACWAGNMAEVKRILSQAQSAINRNVGLWSMTPVLTAAFEGHRDVVEVLVRHGADLSLVDGDGYNILHLACQGGDRETVEFVLSLDGVDVNSRGGESETPVMTAAAWRHRDLVEVLVRHGADVTLVTDGGNNILHCACAGGDRETVEFVLSLDGVDVNAMNNDGKTAADVARCKGLHQLLDLLESRGAVK